MFIEKLNLTADVEQVTNDLNQILTYTHWDPPVNQIALVHRPSISNMERKWSDGVGSLIENGVHIATESEFSVINELVPDYTKEILKRLAEHQEIDIGRSRFMNLLPHRGLSVHKDDSVRYHLVIKTHPTAYLGRAYAKKSIAATCHHLPADGYFYKVDTTVRHFAYNGSSENRIHLVICPR